MHDATSAGPPLTDDDLRDLSRLLARYAEHELEQFDHWKVRVPGSSDAVFIEIANKHRPDVSEAIYVEVWPLPAHLK